VRIRVVVWIIAGVLLLGLTGRARAQYTPPSDQLVINAQKAITWDEDSTTVVFVDNPVTIELDETRMNANSAVIWLTPLSGALAGQHRVEIVLVGDAKLDQPNGISSSSPRLSVTGQVRERKILNAERVGGNRTSSDLYKQAKILRRVPLKGGEPAGPWIVAEEPLVRPKPTSRPAPFRAQSRLRMSFDRMEMQETPEGNVAAILTGHVVLRQQSQSDDYVTLQADRAVVFTPYKNPKDVQTDQVKAISQAAEAAYLEGDVRIVRKPGDEKQGEQRLVANRAYYEFTTDRAVLTDVVLYTVDPKSLVPMVVRARLVRQLSEHEYTAEHSTVSTSSFHTPSFSIGASSTYIRQTDFDNEVTGVRTHFFAWSPTFEIDGIPAFWLPAMAGNVVEKSPLRHAEISHARGFGIGVATEWGVFESLGLLPPKSLDMSYHLDFYSKRGPAAGLDGKYKGGFITETTLQPWTYEGEFTSYLALDHGTDDFGKRRVDVDPERDVRGRIFWQHQSFLPNDWQVQFTTGYISDRNFMEEWFNRDFRLSAPLQTSFYAKRQQDNEAYSFLVAVQPNNFVTVADLYQEQVEVERVPEISYHRIGDSFWQDRVTFFSNNTIGGVKFDPSSANLQDLGFAPRPVGFQSPGIPSLGQTGTPNDVTWRTDFQQELNWPMSAGTIRMVPYVIGRYTYYSQSPEGSGVERVSSGGGIRMTTAFWKVDDMVHSDLWDLQRLRHVIEPQVNFYAGAQSQDRQDIYIYDEPIDAVSGITVAQVAINQRWQTKRGGPGRWRSVDVFTLNTEANFFINQPPDRELDPEDFHGAFFMSAPETSIPRDSINVDAEWQVSDAVTIDGGTEYNMTKGEWATANAMVQVKHSPRLHYNVGWRHIGLDFEEVIRRHPWIPASEDPDHGSTLLVEKQDLVLFGAEYELTSKYKLEFANSYDIAQHRNDRSVVSLVRHFDRFYVSIGLRVDDFQGENTFIFNVWPEGMEPGKGSQAVRGGFSN